MSDTTDDDLSDHDLTPCNASPSLSQLMNWGSGGGPGAADGVGGAGGGGRHFDDDFEERWKEHVHSVMQKGGAAEAAAAHNDGNEKLLKTFDAFGKLFGVH